LLSAFYSYCSEASSITYVLASFNFFYSFSNMSMNFSSGF